MFYNLAPEKADMPRVIGYEQGICYHQGMTPFVDCLGKGHERFSITKLIASLVI